MLETGPPRHLRESRTVKSDLEIKPLLRDWHNSTVTCEASNNNKLVQPIIYAVRISMYCKYILYMQSGYLCIVSIYIKI